MTRQWIFVGQTLAIAGGVALAANSFKFTGRTALIGTVQLLSKTEESPWVDLILAKCAHRDAWLKILQCLRLHRDKSSKETSSVACECAVPTGCRLGGACRASVSRRLRFCKAEDVEDHQLGPEALTS